MKHTGKVVRFGAKGFGFITESSTRIQWFFHIKDVTDRLELQEGDIVSFEEGAKVEGRAPGAIRVTLITAVLPVVKS